MLPPSEFLQLAEETGYIQAIGEQTFAEAFGQFCTWQKSADYPLYLKLNLSQRQFFDPGLVALLDRLMEEHSILGEQISLHIPEALLLSDGAARTGILQRLQAHKILICLDNFGQGATSLRSLNRIPLNVLELDLQLVRRLDFDLKQILSLNLLLCRLVKKRLKSSQKELRAQIRMVG